MRGVSQPEQTRAGAASRTSRLAFPPRRIIKAGEEALGRRIRFLAGLTLSALGFSSPLLAASPWGISAQTGTTMWCHPQGAR
jgi:hypothetical protein